MAYSTGDTILDDEYNIFAQGAAGGVDHAVDNVNSVWDTGSGDLGYGQGSPVSAVSAGSTITAAQWNTLLTRIENLGTHQATSVASYATLDNTDTIAAIGTVQANVTAVYDGRLDANAFGSDITTDGVVTETADWTTRLIYTMVIDFDTAAKFRYFFNAGGSVAMSFSRSGGATTDKNTEWTDLAANCGTVHLTGSASHTIDSVSYSGTTQIGGSDPGSGSSVSGIDAHALTTSDQTLFKQFADTSPYTANFIEIEAKADAAAGSATTITFTTTCEDAAADTANPTHPAGGTDPADLDIVQGNFVATWVVKQPATDVLSNTWGTPTMAGSVVES